MDTVNLYQELLSRFGIEKQTLMLAEEQGELIKAINKKLRGKGDRLSIVEEMADVVIMLQQIAQFFDIDKEEVNLIVNKKLKRTEERLAKGEV